MPTLNWSDIQTVLLDMDGTLLDLHFDNHFWLQHLPQKMALKEGMSITQAKANMLKAYEEVMGTLNWYCLDYWAQRLQLDIMEAKREIQHLIKMREDTLPFLDALHASGREVILVTNAHPDSLSLKIEHTALDKHIDTLVSTHKYGVSKESQSLWQQLQSDYCFDPACTLFVDDSLAILEAAQTFGIGHLLAVENPDSQQGVRDIQEFHSVRDYRTLIEDIVNHPVA